MTQPLIEHYDFGLMVIGGREYRSDVVITPSRVISDWWRLEGHRLQLPDVRDYMAEDYDSVVIGTGYYGYMRVDPEVIDEFRRRGKEVYIERSGKAVEMYNELVRRGRKVLAFFHLTC